MAPVARKAQTLNYINGYAVPGEKSTGLKPVAPVAPAEVVYSEGAPSTLPAWVAYDRKVTAVPHLRLPSKKMCHWWKLKAMFETGPSYFSVRSWN
jgi:hypothetical protein